MGLTHRLNATVLKERRADGTCYNFSEYSSENLRLCLIIVLVHTVLAPELVMRTNGVQIMTICDNLMADMRTEGVVMLTKVIENYIRASPALGCETVKPVLPRIFQ